MQLLLSLKQVFSFDTRSIALFRILLGVLILSDLLLRSRDLNNFYTDAGILPRGQWLELTHRWHWSLHAASGELWWQVALFFIAGLAAIALIVGYRSRWAAVITFILTASLLNRNGLLLQGGDQLLVIMNFWAIFLPLGAKYSFDAALQPIFRHNPNDDSSSASTPTNNLYFSVATIAIVFQILYLYFFTAILKTGDAWVTRFDAAYYAVSLQHFATPIGQWISQFPGLLKLATLYVLAVEFVAPFLVLCPFFWPWIRSIGVILLASLHVAFLLMLHIGLFPLIDFMSLSLLIPSMVWVAVFNRSALAKSNHPVHKLTIYYDKDCGFCLKMCLVLRHFLLVQNVQILPAQQYPSMYKIMDENNSWVITDHTGKHFVHWSAMATLFSQRWPFKPLGWLMRLPPLLQIGNQIYYWIANNRGTMGTFTERFLPYRKLPLQPTWIGSVIAAISFYVVTSYNVYGLPAVVQPMPQHVEYLARMGRLDQRWDMFAPYPLTYSSYVLIPGMLRNGEQVDVYPLTSSEPGWQPGERFFPLYDGYRWRKYFDRVNSHRNNAVRSALGSYLCKSWNHNQRPRQEQLATLEIIFVNLRTNTNNTPKQETRRRAWRHWCFPEFADT